MKERKFENLLLDHITVASQLSHRTNNPSENGKHYSTILLRTQLI